MPESTNTKKVVVIHGPNLNMLGTRQPHIYGHESLDEINTRLQELGKKLKIDVDAFQSNHEGDLIEKIQQAFDAYDGMLINPAAFTHTSIAIRDALAMLSFPIIEIHISNINKREPFRHNSLIADVVTARISGFGINGYTLALRGLAQIMS
jgi:3-dehydroquinate dehydratase-2